MALAAWSEAARYYEASLEAMDEQADPATAIAEHRLVGLCHRYDLDLATAVDHFDAAIRLCRSVGTDEMLADLYIWRLRCGVARHDLIDAVSDAEPIEALVATLEPTAPGLAAQGLVELAQLHLAKGRPEQAESVALDAIRSPNAPATAWRSHAPRRFSVCRSGCGTASPRQPRASSKVSSKPATRATSPHSSGHCSGSRWC